MESYASLNARAAIAAQAEKAERTSNERLARFNADPVAYLKRRAAIGWHGDVPRGADPAVAARALAELETMSSVVKGMTPPAPAVEPEDYAGYHQHKLVDAITEAIRELKSARGNRQVRDQLKEAMNLEFQRSHVGLKVIRWDAWSAA